MPGTTRYSATFDRPYEEDDRADSAPPANARRSRSLSWQAHSGLDGGRPYTPLGSRQPAPRSSSSDNGPSKAAEHIPTRTVAKTTVKTHNNPFQFVKIGTCPLYKKAEEQLKKTKEVKKQDILKEEEEEWQTNLDSWKSRRRKMSEDVFRRQEEIRQFELEEQEKNIAQKKTKTFSEMVNSRATRGRALSLCLLTSPLDFQDWEFENKSLKNGSCSTFTDESEGNSTVNSEDEGVSMRGRLLQHLDNQNNHTNGNAHIEQNGLKLETHNSNYNKLDLTANNGQMKTKEGSYIDSGLESISSSHRAGDTPDSGSDFSQDSNSSIDCDSPRAGVNILEEFSSKSLQISPGQELNLSITLTDKAQEFGFSFQIDKDAGQVLISSVLEGSKAESSGVHLQDQITAIDGIDINSKNHAEITSIINKAKGKGKITLLLWRHNKITNGLDSIEKHVDSSIKQNEAESDDAKNQQYEKSIESENEMYVDDFEELQRQSELLKSNKTENTSTKSQALSNGNISATSTTNSSNKNSIKISAPVLKDTIENGADDEKNQNNTDSNLSTENKKKNIIKVKRVRKKGVSSLDVSGTSNLIPQADLVNYLYPLSPVTELPSPADETKTISSSLSSNPSTPESNSEKENISKKKIKEANIQLNSSITEKNKTEAASKSDVSKTAVPCDKLKFSSLNEVENKTECYNVPSSPTMSTAKDSKLSLENSQEEKAQVPSSPKKLKIKIKKANMSTEQKSPESSPTAKDVVLNSSDTKILDSPVDKKVTIGIKLNKKISSDSNSKDIQVNAIKNEKVESSDKKESNVVASEASVITSDAKSSLKDSSSSVATISSAKARNLSLKIGIKEENMPLPTSSKVKPPKTPTDEKSKPVKSKKEKTNFKGSIILSSENTDTMSEVKSMSPKEKPETCDADKNLVAKTNKLDLLGCKNEASTIAKIEQTQTTLEEKPKPTTAAENKIKLKDEAKNKFSSDVTKVFEDLANSNTSPVKREEVSTAISEPKGTTTTSNDNDSSKLSTVMVNTSETVKDLPKGKSSLKVKTANVHSDVSSDKVSNLSAKNESKIETDKLIPVSLVAKSKLPKTSKEEKANEPVSEKKEKTKLKENILSTKTIVNSEEVEETSVCNDTASSENTKILSLTIDTLKESLDKPTTPIVEKTKSPKTPQDDKLKPSFARKKDPRKSKGDNIQPSGTPTVVQENGKISLKEESKIVNIKDSANLLKIDVLNKSLALEQQQQGTATSNDNDSSKLSTDMVNTSETVEVLPKGRSSLKGKTSNIDSDVSSDKVSNLSAKNESKIETDKLFPVSLVAKNKLPKTSKEEKANEPVSEKIEKPKFKENILSTKTIVNSKEAKEPSVCNDTASSEKTKKLSLSIDTPKELLDKPTSPTVEKTKSPKTPQGDKSKPSFARKKDPRKSKGDNIQTSGTPAVVQENVKSSLKEGSKIVDIKDSANLLKTDVLNESLILEQQQQGTAPSIDNDSSKLSTVMVNTSETVEVLPKGKSSLKGKTSNIDSDVSSDKVSNLSAKNESKIETDKLIPVSLAAKSKLLKTSKDEKVNEPASEKKEKPKFKENILSTKTIVNSEDAKETSVCNDTASSEKTKKLSLNIDTPKESLEKSASPTVEKTKSPKTPQEDKSKPSFASKKDQIKSKGDNIQQSGTSAVVQVNGKGSLKEESKVVDIKDSGNLLLKIEASNESLILDGTVQTDGTKQPKTPQDEKPKPKLVRKRSKPKNINSQNVIAPAKQNEDNLNSNINSLNIVFQSEPKNTLAKNQSNNIVSIENKSNKKIESDLVPDILPVEKVAEEMEKLILEQLEEEERAKELATEIKCSVGTSEQLLIAPPKLAEPPKEKPPPPPTATEGNQKETSLKRVNSTKRIKKEIHKRRSNFLGIDSADESLICGESSVPPPPALEEILKAEMELDRQSRLKIENASTERLTLEEKEIMEKEREIIETLESEERMKNLINGTEMYNDASPASSSDMTYEGDCIFSMKNERKRIEAEHMLPEEQQLNFLEENQLREREEFIRKQEAGNSIQSIADPSFSVAADASNTSQSALSSLTDKNSKVSLSDSNGDGKNNSSNSSMAVSENKSSDSGKKVVTSEKPAVPPKPLKKKEAIRKERERLRQEQEALQREREEHRRKLILEQEELKKQQKSHAPEASVSRLGPIPSLIPPNYPPQLTTTTNATPNARESASFPSRSHHGDTSGVAGSINSVELIGPSVVRQSKMPAPRKAVQNEAWGQQKMPSVRKQNHDSLTESRYNQNHWLIQEAEMRRIAELKERQQRVSQLPCSQTHLAEDDVCSNPPRVPVIPPPHNPHVNYAAVQDKMWNYGQTNVPSKKYPPAVTKDLLHTVYPRETVSQQAPTKPSRVVPLERQEQMLSVSGRKRCSHCNEELGRGAAMIIESLQLYYHIHCFQCCVCQAQLGNGSCGTDVRVRNNKLHCHNCYSNDEAGLKFSQV